LLNNQCEGSSRARTDIDDFGHVIASQSTFFDGQGHTPVALFFKVVPYPCILCADVCLRSWYIIYDKQVEHEVSSGDAQRRLLRELFGVG